MKSTFIRYSLFLGTLAFVLPGCGGENMAPKATDKTELEQYMADHPELANETMPDLAE